MTKHWPPPLTPADYNANEGSPNINPPHIHLWSGWGLDPDMDTPNYGPADTITSSLWLACDKEGKLDKRDVLK